jgi:outer membrane protein, heavy metal efflux system
MTRMHRSRTTLLSCVMLPVMIGITRVEPAIAQSAVGQTSPGRTATDSHVHPIGPGPDPLQVTSAAADARQSRSSMAPVSGRRLDSEEAVQIAMQRNRDVIAARLDVKLAEYDRVAAAMYPNPVLSYQVGNLVIGRGNRDNTPAHPSLFSQPVHTVGIGEVLDIWAKRAKRVDVAAQSQRVRLLQLEDLLREVAHSVRSAFVEALRNRMQLDFSREVQQRYDETVRLSRSRFRAGEISESEYRKIELEGLKYQNAVVDAELESDIARQQLAAIMGLRSAADMAQELDDVRILPVGGTVERLTQQAIEQRPDYRGLLESRRLAQGALVLARREAYPDLTLSVSYTHSAFEISGDNPNTVGLGASIPLPLFDRNQAGIGRAQVRTEMSDNDIVRLGLQIRHDVAGAVRKFKRAETLLRVYREGGMLNRAEVAQEVAERSYKAGAVSLLEFLEAQRTFLEIRDQYLNAVADQQQSTVDLLYVLGRKAE